MEPPYGHPAWIEIDLEQFKLNISNLKAWIGTTKICLPVKANAYGHGLIPIAQAAIAAGVEYLAVSCLQEGAQLRKAGVRIPILVLGAIHEAQIEALIDYDLEFTIASRLKAEMVATVAKRLARPAKIHVEVETGMQRTGMRVETAVGLLQFIQSQSCFEWVGVYSHLALSDQPEHPFTQQQIRWFTEFLKTEVLPRKTGLLCHLANSGGVVHFPESYFDMVRPGILAFGHYQPLPPALNNIKPCFEVKAKIAYFKVVAPSIGIGYGHRYVTGSETRIITIPVGYGDGFRRSLSNKAHILLHGKQYPIVGTICMDQFMVDVHQDPAYVGEVVTLIGRDGDAEVTVIEIAGLADTISYEILCGFNNRLPRLYRTTQGNFWESYQ